MKAETLRGLSRDYAAGDIDRETYRVHRHALLDGIASGAVAVVKYKPPEPESPTVFPYDDDGDTTQEIIPPLAARGAGSRRAAALPVGIGSAIAIAVVLGWLLLKPAAPPPPPALEAAAPQLAGTTAQIGLLEDFLAAGQWSGPAIRTLIERWHALDPAAQAELRRSADMRELGNALQAQYSSESALLELGDADQAFANQARLLELAAVLGLENERLQRARAAWLAHDRQRHSDEGELDAAATPVEPAATAARVVDETAVDETAVDDTAAEETAAGDDAAVPAPPASNEPSAPPTLQSTPDDQSAVPAAEEPATATTTVTTGMTRRAKTKSPMRTNCAADLAQKRRPYCIDILDSGEKGPVLVVLAPGTFAMGGALEREQPRRTITIDYPFAIGLFEVSAGELEQFCVATARSCPTQPWSDPALPAVGVSWDLAQAYTAWLSTITGVSYRLPSEAEWEYAARAGTTTPYPAGDELLPTHAHYSFLTTQEQPLKANDRSINRNDFRLYHMLGNVREWVADHWRASYAGASEDPHPYAGGDSPQRVVRGGSYADHADALRSAARVAMVHSDSDAYTGFRVVRAIER